MNTKAIKGETSMHSAEHGFFRLVNFLDNRVDVNTENIGGQTALIKASRGCDHEAVRLLLDNRADVNAKDNYGGTAIRATAAEGHRELKKQLLNKGAEPNE